MTTQRHHYHHHPPTVVRREGVLADKERSFFFHPKTQSSTIRPIESAVGVILTHSAPFMYFLIQ